MSHRNQGSVAGTQRAAKNMAGYRYNANWAPLSDGEDDLDLTRDVHPAFMAENAPPALVLQAERRRPTANAGGRASQLRSGGYAPRSASVAPSRATTPPYSTYQSAQMKNPQQARPAPGAPIAFGARANIPMPPPVRSSWAVDAVPSTTFTMPPPRTMSSASMSRPARNGSVDVGANGRNSIGGGGGGGFNAMPPPAGLSTSATAPVAVINREPTPVQIQPQQRQPQQQPQPQPASSGGGWGSAIVTSLEPTVRAASSTAIKAIVSAPPNEPTWSAPDSTSRADSSTGARRQTISTNPYESCALATFGRVDEDGFMAVGQTPSPVPTPPPTAPVRTPPGFISKSKLASTATVQQSSQPPPVAAEKQKVEVTTTTTAKKTREMVSLTDYGFNSDKLCDENGNPWAMDDAMAKEIMAIISKHRAIAARSTFVTNKNSSNGNTATPPTAAATNPWDSDSDVVAELHKLMTKASEEKLGGDASSDEPQTPVVPLQAPAPTPLSKKLIADILRGRSSKQSDGTPAPWDVQGHEFDKLRALYQHHHLASLNNSSNSSLNTVTEQLKTTSIETSKTSTRKLVDTTITHSHVPPRSAVANTSTTISSTTSGSLTAEKVAMAASAISVCSQASQDQQEQEKSAETSPAPHRKFRVFTPTVKARKDQAVQTDETAVEKKRPVNCFCPDEERGAELFTVQVPLIDESTFNLTVRANDHPRFLAKMVRTVMSGYPSFNNVWEMEFVEFLTQLIGDATNDA